MAATVPGFEASACHGVFLQTDAPRLDRGQAEVREFLAKGEDELTLTHDGAKFRARGKDLERLSVNLSTQTGLNQIDFKHTGSSSLP
jgi:hypothetical protein